MIPAFNEESKVADDLDAAHGFLEAHFPGRGEIILVDDGSSDQTAARASALSAAYPELEVVSYTPNRGKGHALRQGVARTRGRFVIFADAGSCVPYPDALRGLAMCHRGADIAHGSRYRPGSTINRGQPIHRRLGGAMFRAVTKMFMGVPGHITDTQCGFKVYRGTRARELYAETRADGFMFDIEVIRRALKRNLVITEFPVRWRSDPDSRFRPLIGTLINIRELIGIRLTT